jgi:phosphoglycolate phosphatase
MIIKTLTNSIEAEYVIFDKDGTLVGGINLWKKIFSYEIDIAKSMKINIEKTANKIFGAEEAEPYSPLVTFHASEAPILMAAAIWMDYGLPWYKCKELGNFIIEEGSKKVNKKELYEVLPGAIPAIDFFISKDLPLFIATSDSKENTIDMLKYLNIEKKIKFVVSSDEVEYGKPHPDILYKIESIIKKDIKKGVLIGDNEVDIETAKRAKSNSIIVGPKDLGADGWVKSLDQLIDLNSV